MRPRTERHSTVARPSDRNRRFLQGLWIGLGAGTVLAIAMVWAALATRDPGTPATVASDPSPAAPGPLEPGPEPASPATARATDLSAEIEALRERIEEHLRGRRWNRARRELDSFESAIPDAATRSRYAETLENLRAIVDSDERQARGEPVEGPRAGSTPIHELDRIEEIWRRSVKAREEGRPDEALECLDRILELDGRNPTAWLARARLHGDRKDFEAAHRDADRAIELLPGAAVPPDFVAEAHQFRGEVRSVLTRYEEAEADLRRAIAAAPADGVPVQGLGQVYRVRGEFERALETFRSLEDGKRSLTPEAAFVMFSDFGLALIGLGRRTDALDFLAQAPVRLEAPSHRVGLAALRALAWVHPACGRPDAARARAILDAEVPRGSAVQHVFLAHAIVLCLEDRHAEAFPLFELLGPSWTLFPEAGFYYARSARALGHAEPARHLQEIARRLRPELAKILLEPDQE